MANLIFPKIEEPYVLTKPKSAKKMAKQKQDTVDMAGHVQQIGES